MLKRFVLLACALLAMNGFASRASAADFWLSGVLRFTDTTVSECWVVLRGGVSSTAPPGEFSGTITSATFSSVGLYSWTCGLFLTPTGAPWFIDYDTYSVHPVRITNFGYLHPLGQCVGTLSAHSQNLSAAPVDGQYVYFNGFSSSVPGSPGFCQIDGMLTYSTTPPIFP
jgi:hypothetical protein